MSDDFSRLGRLFGEAVKLKDVVRKGWLRCQVPEPESSAAHSWGVGFLALLLCPPELNKERVLSLAIIHDLPEIKAGDITPYDGVSVEDKHAAELEAIKELDSGAGTNLTELFQEYLDSATPEAKFIHACDKLDMAITAKHYSERSGIDLQEFIDSASSYLNGNELSRFIVR
ncbi:MAG: HD domain-containing protein [bacterium]|nr:HD domain-containing protein [bacterium]